MDQKTFQSKKAAVEADRVKCINDAFYLATYDLNNQSFRERFKMFTGSSTHSLDHLKQSVDNCDNTRNRIMDQLVKEAHKSSSQTNFRPYYSPYIRPLSFGDNKEQIGRQSG